MRSALSFALKRATVLGTVAAAAAAIPLSASAAPAGPPTDDALPGVAVTSATNAWAVGSYSDGTNSQTLIERWNGSSWKTVTSPNLGGPGFDNALAAVAATSSSNAWAVGHWTDIGLDHTEIEHWNGSSWKVSASPNPGSNPVTGSNDLFGVAAASAGRAWAVGTYTNDGSTYQSMILRWNGGSWTQATSTNPGTAFDGLQGITALSGSNAWAVGSYSNGGANKTLIEHWNGAKWTTKASPNVGTKGDNLFAVAGTSASNVWAVGDRFHGTANQTLIEHWNGASWKVVKSPNPGGDRYEALFGVTAISPRDAWATGSYVVGSTYMTMILHWNGFSWKQVKSPHPSGAEESFLADVASTRTGHVWAVGYYTVGASNRTLIARFNGTSWKQVTSPNK